ncbi:unnamed protein product [Amoebophrya sp. A120]|nr:unnamed protein product [Amoebophrya sp. A120]|eukprot:GSA120T00000878001.1
MAPSKSEVELRKTLESTRSGSKSPPSGGDKEAKQATEAAASTDDYTPSAYISKAKGIQQFAPIALLLASNKYPLEDLGVNNFRALHVIVNVFALLALVYIRREMFNAQAEEEKTGKALPEVDVPAKMVMGAEQTPACKMGRLEYDLTQWKEQLQKTVISWGMLMFIHMQFGALLPLAFQIVTVPLELIVSPLFESYVVRNQVPRPFAAPASPFAEVQERWKKVQEEMKQEQQKVEEKKEE